MRKIIYVLASVLIVIGACYTAHRIKSAYSERQVLTGFRLLLVPHEQLNNIPSYSEHLDFNRLFKVSYTDSRHGFGLFYFTETTIYQGVIPSGAMTKSPDFSSWNKGNGDAPVTLSKITSRQLWENISSNEYQNVATKTRCFSERCSWTDITQTNWLNDFWITSNSIGSFVTVNSRLFIPAIILEDVK